MFKNLILCAIFFATYCVESHANLSIYTSCNYSSMVIDGNSGEILSSIKPHEKRYPASLTKMMTLYLTFEAIKHKKLSFTDIIIISNNASNQPKSNINLKPKQRITVKKAIEALIVKSANDAAVALAEKIIKDENKFVYLMNKKAKELKLWSTNFQNPHGLYSPMQYTTAYDMARLAMALRKDFPKYYHLFSMKSFWYKGKKIRTHNHVLGKYKHADGLKTGYIKASGYNIATSASRKKIKLIAVVMGGQNHKIRDDHTIKLLETAYNKLESKNIHRKNLLTIKASKKK